MVDSWGDGWNGNVFAMGTFGQATLAQGSAGSADIAINVVCPVLGCTDPAAVNYDASANTDDGSCAYACTAAPYSENFDLGLGTWTNGGWINNSYGTPSSFTGPTDDVKTLMVGLVLGLIMDGQIFLDRQVLLEQVLRMISQVVDSTCTLKLQEHLLIQLLLHQNVSISLHYLLQLYHSITICLVLQREL